MENKTPLIIAGFILLFFIVIAFAFGWAVSHVIIMAVPGINPWAAFIIAGGVTALLFPVIARDNS